MGLDELNSEIDLISPGDLSKRVTAAVAYAHMDCCDGLKHVYLSTWNSKRPLLRGGAHSNEIYVIYKHGVTAQAPKLYIMSVKVLTVHWTTGKG